MVKKPTYEELEQRVRELEKTANDRVSSEKQLKLLSLAIDQSSEGVAVVDLDGDLEYLNTAVAEMHGYSAEELVGKNLSIFHTPEQMSHVEKANLEIKQKGRFKGEIWHVKLDGTVFPTLMQNSLVRDDTAKPIGMIGTLRDITDIKQAEEKLRQSEEDFCNLFNNAEVGMFRTRIDGTEILDMNEKFLDIFGHKRSEIQGLPSMLHWADPNEREEMVRRLKLEGRLTDFECRIQNEQGEVRTCLAALRLYHKEGLLEGSIIDITERKQAEEILKEQTKTLNDILEKAADGICVCHNIPEKPYVRFTHWNPRMTEITGYTIEEINRLGWYQSMYPDPEVQQKAIERMIKMRKHNDIHAEEWLVTAKSGGEKTLSISTSVVKEEDGTIHVLALMQDITERKEVEEALRESEKKFRFLAENMVDIVWTLDRDFRTTYVSPSIEKLLGFTAEERKQQALEEMITPESLQNVQMNFLEELKRDEDGVSDPDRSVTMEVEYYRKDGSTVWMENSIKAIRDLAGEIVGMHGVSRDITERMQAETVLRKSEEKYRHLVENINDIIYEVDSNGVIIYTSKAAETITGYNQNELIGRNIFDFLHREDLTISQQQFQKVLSGQLGPSEYRFIKKSGEIIWIRSSSRPIYEEGNPVGLRGVASNISETKKMEEKLRQSHKMEAIGTLAGGIAHEFNNILGIIIGNTELAIDDVPEWNPAKDCLEEIRSASLRAKDVVRQIMSFARKTLAERKPINIGVIVKESLKLLRATIPTSIELRQEILCDTEMILANSTEINQILLNLCGNSAHAMEEKPGIIEVKLETVILDDCSAEQYKDFTTGEYVKLTVKDTGTGIDPEIMDRIFDPYFTTKDVGKGLGLGLAVVFGIVKKHDGAIKLMGEVGKGTTAEVLFPITEARADAEVKESDALPTGTERILFVDDEASLVKMARQMLERQGYEVVGITSSTEALELFQAEPDQFDLVITDMTMPHLTGDKLAARLMQIKPDIPIIFCTGFSEKIDEKKAKEIGASDYIEKPINMRDFAFKVRKVLDAE